MKKILFALALIIAVMTGCSEKEPSGSLAGAGRVEELLRDAAEYDGASYLFTNMLTGDFDQEFSYYYDEEDRLVYVYINESGGSLNVEYNNGKINYFQEGGLNSYVLEPSSEDFKAYDRKNPHSFATGGVLFWQPDYISGAEEKTDENGNVFYTYTYDAEKMSGDLDEPVRECETTYAFRKDGSLMYFMQYMDRGNGGVSHYRIDIREINALGPDEIINPLGDYGE